MAEKKAGSGKKPAGRKGTVPRAKGKGASSRDRKARVKTAAEAAAEAKRRSDAAKKGAETRARRAAERAKEAGATGSGHRLPEAKARLRDIAVIACIDAGWTQDETAEELGITDRTVRNILERARKGKSPLEARPVELVERRMKGLARSAQTHRLFAFECAERFPAVALGAMKAADAVESQLDEMLVAIGKLPEDLALLRAQAEMERVQTQMVRCMKEVESGERTAAEAVEFFETLLESPEDELARLAGAGGDDGGGG